MSEWFGVNTHKRKRNDLEMPPAFWSMFAHFETWDEQKSVIRDLRCPKCQCKSLMHMSTTQHLRVLFVVLPAGSAGKEYFKCNKCGWVGTDTNTPFDIKDPVPFTKSKSFLDQHAPLDHSVSVGPAIRPLKRQDTLPGHLHDPDDHHSMSIRRILSLRHHEEVKPPEKKKGAKK